MQVYNELVMLKGVVTLLCVLSNTSMTVLICCLFTCMAYLVTFSIEMTGTKISCCWVCVSMSWSTLPLTSLMYLVVVVLVSQLRAFPKKGKRLLLVHVLRCDIPLIEGSLLRSWVAVSMSSLKAV